MRKKINTFLFSSMLIVFCMGGCASVPAPRLAPQAPQDGESFSGKAAYHFSMAILLKQDGDLTGAVLEMQKALGADPDSPYLIAEMIALYIENSEADRARKLGEEALEKYPEATRIRSIMGGLYFHLREYDRAIAEYKTVIRHDPKNLVAYFYLATIYAMQKKYEDSEKAFQDFLVQDPDNLMGNYYYARVLSDMNRTADSEALFKKVIMDRPDFEAAVVDLAALYERTGQLDQAISVYRDMLVSNPARSNLRLKIGDLLIRQKKPDAAEKEFLEVLLYEPDHREARTALGLLYYDMEKLDLAIAEFTTLLSRNVSDDRIRYLLANTLDKSGDDNGAVGHYLRVSPSFELYANARIQAAMILKAHKKNKEAVALLQQAITIKQDQVILYLYLSSLQEDQKDMDGALQTLLAAGRLFPRDVDVHYALGMVYEKTDRLDESISAMEAVLKIDPEHADALNFIGYSWADRDMNLDEAEDLIVRALKLKPDSAYILDSLGWVHFKKKKYDSALLHLKKAHDLLPDDPTILEHLGDVYLKIGRNREAQAAYQKALQMDPDSSGLKKKLDHFNPNP
ncbi:MAG: tetratricopeptide repeat protein [Smithellaceae bacterium]